MFEHVEQIMAVSRRANRALQEGLAYLVLFIGALLFAMFMLLLPNMLKGMFSGDPAWSKAFLMDVAAIGISWLQWRYRHLVYPQLRKRSPNGG